MCTVVWLPPLPVSDSNPLSSSTNNKNALSGSVSSRPDGGGGGASPPMPSEQLGLPCHLLSWAHPTEGGSDDLTGSSAPTTVHNRLDKHHTAVSWSGLGSDDTAALTTSHATTSSNTSGAGNNNLKQQQQQLSSFGRSLSMSFSTVAHPLKSSNSGGGWTAAHHLFSSSFGNIPNFLSMSLRQSACGGDGGYIAYQDEQEASTMPIKVFLGRDCSSNERVVVWVQQLQARTKKHHRTNPTDEEQNRPPAMIIGGGSEEALHGQHGPLPFGNNKVGSTRGILHAMGSHLQRLSCGRTATASSNDSCMRGVESNQDGSAPGGEAARFVPGVPRLLYFDTEKNDAFQCLVHPALGPTLLTLVRYCGGRLSERTVIALGIQLLHLLKHCAGSGGGGLTLNDVSPSTLRFGTSSVDSHVVYMTSFAHCTAVGSKGIAVPAGKHTNGLPTKPLPTTTTTTAAAAANVLSSTPTTSSTHIFEGPADPLNVSAVSHGSRTTSTTSSFPAAPVSLDQFLLARSNNLAFGSARYHLGLPVSPADDAESVAYVLAYCLTGSLPWLSSSLLLETRGCSSSAHYDPNAALLRQLAREAEYTPTIQRLSPTDLFARQLYRVKEQYVIHSSTSRLPSPLVDLFSATQKLSKVDGAQPSIELFDETLAIFRTYYEAKFGTPVDYVYDWNQVVPLRRPYYRK